MTTSEFPKDEFPDEDDRGESTQLFAPTPTPHHAAYSATPSRYDSEGFDPTGLDCDGYDRDGYDVAGRSRDGYDRYGYDAHGVDINGFDRYGYDLAGFDFDGYDRAGFNRYGYDRTGYDRQGISAARTTGPTPDLRTAGIGFAAGLAVTMLAAGFATWLVTWLLNTVCTRVPARTWAALEGPPALPTPAQAAIIATLSAVAGVMVVVGFTLIVPRAQQVVSLLGILIAVCVVVAIASSSTGWVTWLTTALIVFVATGTILSCAQAINPSSLSWVGAQRRSPSRK